MLNPFPIQFLSLFAYFILRVITGLVLLVLGRRHLKQSHLNNALAEIKPTKRILVFALLEIIVGVMLILGWYTQIAALILISLSGIILFIHKKIVAITLPSRLTYLLFLAIGLSLFITGAGVPAFDLPI
jgi:uncharacterized membrane protein YphA (DoxX/SURF4 family)